MGKIIETIKCDRCNSEEMAINDVYSIFNKNSENMRGVKHSSEGIKETEFKKLNETVEGHTCIYFNCCECGEYKTLVITNFLTRSPLIIHWED